MGTPTLSAEIVRGDGERFRLEGTRNGGHGMWTCAVIQGPPDDEVRVQEWGSPDVAGAAARLERFAATATARAFARPIGA